MYVARGSAGYGFHCITPYPHTCGLKVVLGKVFRSIIL